jgi:RNA polymerase sigma-70 factor (ECF subfamily)
MSEKVGRAICINRSLDEGATMARPMYPHELALPEDEGIVAQSPALQPVSSTVEIDFEELFERYSSMVFGLAYQILGDREEALDVSQEVFLAIYRKIGSFRGESTLKTWIYRITIHRAANRFRWWNRLRRRGTVSLEDHLERGSGRDLLSRVKSNGQSPEESLLAQEERSEIEKLLLELPLQQRIAVVMRDIEGLTYEEIAESTKASLGTVKSRIARGRETLKRHFNGAMC